MAILLLSVGAIFLLIGICLENIIFDIVSLPFFIVSLIIFVKISKTRKQKKDSEENISKSKQTLNISSQKNIVSNNSSLTMNNFDVKYLTSTFQCTMLLKQLRDIKSSPNFNPNMYSFNIDNRILQVERISNEIFLKSGYKNFCAIDLETTGLSVENDRIIQVAIVKVINGQINETFSTYVNPKCHIKQSASEINNIYDEDVKNSKTIKELFPEILAFIGSLPLIAHKAEFDIGFLSKEYFRNFGKDLSKYDIKCTMKIWREKYSRFYGTQPHSSKLATLVLNLLDKMEIEKYRESQHNALCDARATALVFMKLFGER